MYFGWHDLTTGAEVIKKTSNEMMFVESGISKSSILISNLLMPMHCKNESNRTVNGLKINGGFSLDPDSSYHLNIH